MGIGGIHYTGPDGKRRKVGFTRVPTSEAELYAQMGIPRPSAVPRGAVTPPLPGMDFSGDMSRRMAQASQRPMPGSAITETQNGLALRGEERTPLIEGKKIYGSVDGRKDYFPLEKYDPMGAARRVGPPSGEASKDADTHEVAGFGGEDGVSVPHLTRLFLERDGNLVTLLEYERESGYSPGRRLGTVSPERRRVVGTWKEGGEGEEETLRPFTMEGTINNEGQPYSTPSLNIYIPPKCISYGDDATISPIGLTPRAERGDYWYALDRTGTWPTSASPGEEYLLVMKSPQGAVVAALDEDPNTTQYSSYQKLLVVCIGTVYAENGRGVVERQLLCSNVHIGAQPPPDYGTFRWQKGVGTSSGVHYGAITHCSFMFGRGVYTISDKNPAPYSDAAHTWYLVIPHSNPGGASISDSQSGGTDDSQTVIPLFSTDVSGDITADYRALPTVPVYEPVSASSSSSGGV